VEKPKPKAEDWEQKQVKELEAKAMAKIDSLNLEKMSFAAMDQLIGIQSEEDDKAAILESTVQLPDEQMSQV